MNRNQHQTAIHKINAVPSVQFGLSGMFRAEHQQGCIEFAGIVYPEAVIHQGLSEMWASKLVHEKTWFGFRTRIVIVQDTVIIQIIGFPKL